LGAAAALLDQPVLWRYQAEGLAVFAGPGAFRALRLPLAFAELVTVSERFHVKPLLPYFGADGHFFVMALSQNRIRLLEGSAHSIDEVELSEVPASLADALHHDDPERELLYHVVGGGRGGRAVFHGQILRGEHAPLVLVGVQYGDRALPRAQLLPELEAKTVAGNPDDLRPDQLHERAWALPFAASDQERWGLVTDEGTPGPKELIIL
jgi:hypothetical protein